MNMWYNNHELKERGDKILMASVVYYKNSKTGRTYAYEVEAQWNSEKGYSVPKRKYLGRVDPVTNEIIPSTGKPGRKASVSKSANETVNEENRKIEELEARLAEALETIQTIRQEAEQFKRERAKEQTILKKLHEQLGMLIH